MNAGTAVAKQLSNASKEVGQASAAITQTRPYPGTDEYTLMLLLKNVEAMLRQAEASCAEAEI